MSDVEDFVVDENGNLVKEPWYKKAADGFKKGMRATGNFVKENKKEILATMAITGLTAVGVAKANARAWNHKREAVNKIIDEYNKDMRIWDAKNGFYVTLNRQLTAADREILDAARQNGESITETAAKLGLLYDGTAFNDGVLKAWNVKK